MIVFGIVVDLGSSIAHWSLRTHTHTIITHPINSRGILDHIFLVADHTDAVRREHELDQIVLRAIGRRRRAQVVCIAHPAHGFGLNAHPPLAGRTAGRPSRATAAAQTVALQQPRGRKRDHSGWHWGGRACGARGGAVWVRFVVVVAVRWWWWCLCSCCGCHGRRCCCRCCWCCDCCCRLNTNLIGELVVTVRRRRRLPIGCQHLDRTARTGCGRLRRRRRRRCQQRPDVERVRAAEDARLAARVRCVAQQRMGVQHGGGCFGWRRRRRQIGLVHVVVAVVDEALDDRRGGGGGGGVGVVVTVGRVAVLVDEVLLLEGAGTLGVLIGRQDVLTWRSAGPRGGMNGGRNDGSWGWGEGWLDAQRESLGITKYVSENCFY